MSDRHRQPEQHNRLSERERTKIEGRFGMVLLLLIIAVFFSISAPDGPWAQLLITVVLAASLSIAMLASGVRPKVLQAWLGFAVLGVGASIIIAITQEPRTASGYLALTSLLLTLATISAIARRIWQHVEISVLTILGALCIYVLLGLSFAFCTRPSGIWDRNPSSPRRRRGRAATTCISASSRWPRWATAT